MWDLQDLLIVDILDTTCTLTAIMLQGIIIDLLVSIGASLILLALPGPGRETMDIVTNLKQHSAAMPGTKLLVLLYLEATVELEARFAGHITGYLV